MMILAFDLFKKYPIQMEKTLFMALCFWFWWQRNFFHVICQCVRLRCSWSGSFSNVTMCAHIWQDADLRILWHHVSWLKWYKLTKSSFVLLSHESRLVRAKGESVLWRTKVHTFLPFTCEMVVAVINFCWLAARKLRNPARAPHCTRRPLQSWPNCIFHPCACTFTCVIGRQIVRLIVAGV